MDRLCGRWRRTSPACALRDGLGAQGKVCPAGHHSAQGRVGTAACAYSEGSAAVAIGTNHVRAQIGDIRFTSKLIDGDFPNIPRHSGRARVGDSADRDTLRQALQRTAILSNEKYRGIRITVKTNTLTVQAHNPEQEEAEEEIEVNYEGADLEVGFNVNYLLDALAAIDGQEVELGLTDSNSSCLIRSPGAAGTRYVVMPMRL